MIKLIYDFPTEIKVAKSCFVPLTATFSRKNPIDNTYLMCSKNHYFLQTTLKKPQPTQKQIAFLRVSKKSSNSVVNNPKQVSH